MKKIFVTGSNGQLGSEIKKTAAQYPDFEFIFTDIEELDITKDDDVRHFFHENGPFDYIVNCAAYTQVDKAETEIEKAFMVNEKAVKNLVLMAAATNTKMIHISTDYVFDGNKNTPYTENDDVNPVSVYGRSKLGGEKALIHSSVKHIIIRTSWLYSAYGHNFVKTITRLSAEKSELKVVFDQAGSPTYAADLARVILRIIGISDNQPEKFVQGIYHYANQGVCSWYDLAVEIVTATGHKCKVIPIGSSEYPSPVKRPSYSVFNTHKIKTTFDIEIPHWRQSLKICLHELVNPTQLN